jgi:hypothetical protein
MMNADVHGIRQLPRQIVRERKLMAACDIDPDVTIAGPNGVLPWHKKDNDAYVPHFLNYWPVEQHAWNKLQHIGL